jgi:RnfABCDGE-type electron transport complex G subunit
MKTAIRFVIVLGIICLVMGGGVAVLYATFEQKIAEKEARQLETARLAVLPQGNVERVPGSEDVYRSVNDQGDVLGYAAAGEEKGYSSTVKILVGFKPDGKTIHKVAVIDQMETPGLGANVNLTQSSYTLWQKIKLQPTREPEVSRNAFLDKFVERNTQQLGEIDAMPAATITSDAVKNGVRQAADRVTKALGKE